MDISDTVLAKSDQLNAEDLLPGPITVKILGVKRCADEQPVAIEIDGGWKPWKPCKTMRRLMIFAWPDCVQKAKDGEKPIIDPTVWIGRSITLMRDPTVKWAGALVGGIRISAMSHITSPFDISLSESKGKKKLVTVAKLGNEKLATKQQPKPAVKAPSVSSEAFVAMKDGWKSAIQATGGVLSQEAFAAFVESATSGLVLASEALTLASYSDETLAKCVQAVSAIGGVSGGDSVPF